MKPLRLVLFGSFYRGYNLLGRALELEKKFPEKIKLVGIATDDPFAARVSPQTRVWQYVTDQRERDMVVALAKENNIPVWRGSIKIEEFQKLFAEEWMPDIGYMGTFGQRVPARIFDQLPLGFYNFHPCVDREWPSYPGGNPFKEMMDEGETSCVLSMHEVNEQWDNGALVAFSRSFSIEPFDTVLSLHRKTSEAAAEMMEWHLGKYLYLPKTSAIYADSFTVEGLRANERRA